MAVKKVKLADVLWQAANKRLQAPETFSFNGSMYSCNAAMWAEMPKRYESTGNLEPLRKDSLSSKFLASLGCPVNSMHAFRGRSKDHIQGVRYMWLLLAMHVAEDEGIEIEVER